ncbi:MAG: hypothetical protein KC478_00265, partial [Bacteriovoracaceae bacterium]|nr:hypothetical protein [Bacteriovoracaceae bacterium]
GEFWKRVDPTGFVSPERINAGVQGLNQDSEWMKTNRFYYSFLQARAVFENINYKLALFFDNYDKEAQKLLAASLSLELKAFYYASALLLIVTCIFFYLSIKGKRIKRNEEDIYFERFVKKLKKKKVMVDESMNEQVIINRCLDAGLSNYAQFMEHYRDIKYRGKLQARTQLVQAFKKL